MKQENFGVLIKFLRIFKEGEYEKNFTSNSYF